VTLLSGVQTAGPHVVSWDGRSDSGQTVAAGVYHSVLETPDGRSSLRMVLVK
jgi:flagellar hook assembly protein FlgD